jgi:SAM-dependent methyltransferase
MSLHPSAADWAGARGAQWCAHLAHMESTLAPVNDPLLGALRLAQACRIAEIGCGGGGTALAALRRAPAGSTIHGFDISPALIERAQQRTSPTQRELEFYVADMGVAAPAQPYDRLYSRFGVMFFDDPEAAFANLHRWLNPGGTFAFAVWGPPQDNPWMTSTREVVARLMSLPTVDPDAPGPFRYADSAKLVAVLERAGFADVEVGPWRGELRVGGGMSPAEAAGFALASMSGFEAMLRDAGGDTLDQARRALTADLSKHQHLGAVVMPASIHLVTGAR